MESSQISASSVAVTFSGERSIRAVKNRRAVGLRLVHRKRAAATSSVSLPQSCSSSSLGSRSTTPIGSRRSRVSVWCARLTFRARHPAADNALDSEEPPPAYQIA